MQHFSKEYLDKLIAEHKLISVSIARLSGQNEYAGYMRNQTNTHGVNAVDGALLELRRQKVILEAQIDTIRDFLD